MKIAIDLGHGIGEDRGAESKFITEEKIINEVGALVINKLKTLGHTIIEVRPVSATSVGDSLIQRVQKANSNNVDLYVSIHANAGGGKGSEVYTYQGKEVKEARNVLNNLVSLGFINRGIKGANLFVVNQTKAKAMLIEICFVDTQSDVDLYNKLGTGAIADAIVKGLVGSTIQATVNNINIGTSNINLTLRDWQSAYNSTYNNSISVDGLYGPETERAIQNTLISQGQVNALVGFIQCRVGASIDNNFGTVTKQKVIEWQRDNGLSADGIFGSLSFKKMLGL